LEDADSILASYTSGPILCSPQYQDSQYYASQAETPQPEATADRSSLSSDDSEPPQAVVASSSVPLSTQPDVERPATRVVQLPPRTTIEDEVNETVAKLTDTSSSQSSATPARDLPANKTSETAENTSEGRRFSATATDPSDAFSGTAKPSFQAEDVPDASVNKSARSSPSAKLESPTPASHGVESNRSGEGHQPNEPKSDSDDRSTSANVKKTSPIDTNEILFADLPLSDAVKQAVAEAGYEKPTDIQAQIIPYVLEGRDVLAQSQTGTGKTAAFALPILSKLDAATKRPQVLVLAPTRELAIQVGKSFSSYAKHVRGFAVATIYGGQDYEPQLRQLRRGVHVVVGTPGRVIDHVNRGTLDLSAIKTLVLDEADEMLNMGFLEDVEFVLQKAPKERQIALFSATLPGPIKDIANNYLNNPAKISIQRKTVTAESIRQRAVFVSPRDKVDTLIRFVEAEQTDGVIVFTKTREATINVAERLCNEGLSAVALNGDMPQKTRERTIENLKSGRLDILVATDVAARGLDVSRISHVFNFDLPHDSESYVHRVGRTGRAGRNGEAIIFLTNSQRRKLQMIERATKQRIEIVDVPTAKDVNALRIQQFKDQITEVTGSEDLTFFKDIIAKYAEETGKPLDMIAAALAHIGQRGRPFLTKDQPSSQGRERNTRDSNSRDGGRGDRRDGNSGSFERGGGSRHRSARPSTGMHRYRIEVGYDDGVKPGNIVGAVANEAGINGELIGPISIHDGHSTIDLPEGMPREIYQTLRRTWVCGKQLQLRLEDERSSGGNGGYGGGGNDGGDRRGSRGPSRGNDRGGRKFDNRSSTFKKRGR
jgi:ATP-dependent RNA helicase DeaD